MCDSEYPYPTPPTGPRPAESKPTLPAPQFQPLLLFPYLVWYLMLCLSWLATDFCWNWKKSALGSPSQAFCDRSLCQKSNISYCSLEAFCLGMGQGRVTDSVESGFLTGESLTDKPTD